MKIIIVLAMLTIIASLGAAMYFLLNDNRPKKRTVNALMLRVGISLGLIIFLAIGYLMGWIQPHGL